MINISFQYRLLLELSVLHSFFQNNEGKYIQYVPTKGTSENLHRLGWVVKSSANGLKILYDEDRKDIIPDQLATIGIEKLSFLLFTDNRYFFNFTDLPSENHNKILYFNNLSINKKVKAGLLHKKDHVSADDLFEIGKVNLDVAANKPEKVEVKSEDGIALEPNKQLKESSVLFDLSDLVEGRYRIYESGKEKAAFVFPGEGMIRRPLALIDIYLTDSILKDIKSSITDNELLTSYSYTVSFQNRSTYWKYFIVPKYSNGTQHLEIFSNESEINFKGPEEVALPNGQKAALFISDKPIYLKELTEHRFQLKKKNGSIGGNGKVILNRLPAPNFEVIKPESRQDNAKVFSEIIVYI